MIKDNDDNNTPAMPAADKALSVARAAIVLDLRTPRRPRATSYMQPKGATSYVQGRRTGWEVHKTPNAA